MLPEAPVVEPYDEPQPRIETARGERGPDVGLVVVMDEREGGGPFHTGLGEYGLSEFGGFQDPFGTGGFGRPVGRPLRPLPVARGPVHRRGHPVEQRRGPRPPDHRRPHTALGGRHDQGHPLAVHTTQFGGQPVRQGVVPGHHHVRGRVGRRALIRKGRHEGEECRTGMCGSRGRR